MYDSDRMTLFFENLRTKHSRTLFDTVMPASRIFQKGTPPKMEHVKKDGYFHQVQSSGYVVVSEHDQALAELQGGLLEEVSFPVAAEDLLQELSVDLWRVLLDQFVQQYPAVRIFEA